MEDQKDYDIIGDIHGQHGKLVELLEVLGYRRHGETYCHPEGRRVIFLGDYIDRGPAVREVLHTVRGMVEAGDALAIAGNHEFNAICYHTEDGKGGWLREHSPEKNRQIQATLDAFVGLDAEWDEWLGWMADLPCSLDLGELRVVHACWDDLRLGLLGGSPMADPVFLGSCAERGSPEHDAIETCLKGPELALPDGGVFVDKDGVSRHAIRSRWWDVEPGMDFGELCLPVAMPTIGVAITGEDVGRLPLYPLDAPPVFFGHYWLPADTPKRPLRHNLACLDFSAAKDGPMVAYRWHDGDSGPLREERLFSVG